MAKLYGEIAAKALLTLDKSFARANGQPLDASEVYYGLQAAKDYAATAQAYIGQKIVVVEDDLNRPQKNEAGEIVKDGEGNTLYEKKVTHYSVEDTAGNLKELGSKPVGDEKSITVAEDGTVSLAGIGTLVFEREVDVIGEDGQPTGEKKTETIQYQPLMTKDGLVWIEPSKTTVEGLATLIEGLAGRVDALEADVAALEKVALKPAEGAEAKPEENLWDAIAAAEEALGGRVEDLEDTLEGAALTDTTYTVKEGDKVLSLTGTEFSTQIGLTYTNDRISLTGINGEEIAGFDASAFVADGVLEDANYDATTKELVFTWNIKTGENEDGTPIYKTDRVNIGDLIDTYTAGNGLELNNNQFSVKVPTTDKYLTVDETGVHTKGIDEAIAAAVENLPTEDTNTTYTLGGNGVTVTLTPSIGEAQEFKLDAYTKSEADSKIDEKIASVTGGESAADVKLALESYRDAINTELWGEEAKNWTVTTEEDGKTKVTYTPQYGNTSRVDTLETKVKALEDVGAQANVLEGVQVNGTDLKITNKKVDIDLSNYASTTAVGTAQAAAEAAQKTADEAKSAASTNAGEIEGIKTNYVTNTALSNTLANYLNATQVAETYLDKTTAGQTYLSKNDAAETYLDKVSAGSTYATKASVEGLSGTVTNLTETVNGKANASEVYSKTDIDTKTGTIPEGSSIMAEIAKAQSAATYDDTEVKASIDAIYKAGEGENAATGVLADEIARATAAEAANAKSIADLAAAVDNVSNIMNFRGVVAVTEAGFEEDVKAITEPKDGDVIIYGEQEYVYNNGWVLFGDASGNAAAITALTARVEANETAVKTTLPGAITKALTDAKAYTDEQITALGMANYTVKSVVSGHEAIVVDNVDGVVTIGFADEIVLNGGSAN